MSKVLFLISTLFLSLQVKASRYDDIVNQLLLIKKNSPNYVNIVSLGKNDQDQNILALKIEFPIQNEKINQLVVAAHHGNETLSVPVSLEFAGQVLNILKNPDHPFHTNFKNKRFHVIPALNISGINNNRREEYDIEGISHDPNRDYPDACNKTKKNFKLKSTSLLTRYIYNNKIVSAATVHGYIGTLTFPWGMFTKNTHTHDHQSFLDLTQYAVKANSYEVGTHADLIYPAEGSFEDYMYLGFGIWTVLLEIDHNPNISKDANSLVRFFYASPNSRSNQHQHTADCKSMRRNYTPMSRP
ncbi:MAG: M14 family zinc carboxypeptidase [Bdellovibrionota bacterium]|nr:M14 family zinc carboxypeptidase [Bdellovibrionota bacterium]